MMAAAMVLAAGLSRRMGRFKLLLPWNGQTVIEQVVAVLQAADVSDVLVVTGHQAAEVSAAIAHTGAHTIFNAGYADGEMLGSLKAGLGAADAGQPGILLCLGDQPQIQTETVAAVLRAARAEAGDAIIIPSYQMRAGHPIWLPRWLWPEILSATTDLRTVLAPHRHRVHYLTVDTGTILDDLDTPEDYERSHGKHL